MSPVGSGALPDLGPTRRTVSDLQTQLWGLLARCGEDVVQAARRRRRWRFIRRFVFGAVGKGNTVGPAPKFFIF